LAGICGGVLQWPEEQFWNSSIPYIFASIKAVRKFHGGKEEREAERFKSHQKRLEELEAKGVI
jgi:hypothetical protein